MIRVVHAHLLVAAQTHPGRSGKQNEDRFSISAYRVGPSDPTPALFAVVADGIGGHRSGELAAEMAVNAISHAVAQSDGFEPLVTLREAVLSASLAIAERALADTRFAGMGTTCACVWVIGLRLYAAAVGDSRIYLLRDHVLHQLSTDHTWIREAVEKGVLTAAQARGNPNAHVIRRYLGSPRPPEADLRMRMRPDETDHQAEANQGLLLQPDDCLLLCSDGLTDEVADNGILGVLSQVTVGKNDRKALLSAARKLVDLANDHGGKDNITAVLVQVPGRQVPERRLSRTWSILIAAGLFLLLLTAGVTIYLAINRVLAP